MVGRSLRSSRSRRAIVIVGGLVGISFLVLSIALGNPASGFFELDGNITSQGLDDWATLNAGGGSAVRFSGISEDVVNGTQKASAGVGTDVCSGILPSGSTLTTCDDVATGGSTKDDINFSSWKWIWQQANDKNDIEHTFAALYNDTSGDPCTAPNTPAGCNPNFGHNFAVFGLDKLSNSGSASVGFWFTNDQITLSDPGINNSPNGSFVGSHQNGDVLVQSDFTSGGSVSRVEVFVWCSNNPAGVDVCDNYPGPASHPNLISQGQQAFDCTTATATAGFCGIATQAATTNTQTVWPFLYKFSGGVAAADTYPAATFFEGGVDLTRLFGDTIPCFSTGIGETRQSQSETSVLVDFHLFSFDVCSANISIAPNGVNEVGGTHKITATVTKKVVNTSSPAPNGTVVNFTKTGAGSFVDDPAPGIQDSVDSSDPGTDPFDDCVTSGGTGQCSVWISSNAAGTTTVNASTSVDFGSGVMKSASTTGTNGNSGPVTKRWVDGNISITPSATNEVGQNHTFDITVNASPSGATPDFLSITPSITPSGFTTVSESCSDPNDWGGSGNTRTCSITITSSSAGTFTADATAQIKFTDSDSGANPADVTISRTTDETHGSSGSATKTFVDAAISIAPDATNEVGDPHTFTVTVTQDAGDGNGLVAAGNGHVDFTLTDSNGAANVLDAASSTCDNAGENLDANGECTIVFTSNSAGQVTGHATVTLTVGGVSLTRETDGLSNNSDDAVKTFVDAAISIGPNATNAVGDPHTFTVTVTQDAGDGNGLVAAGNGHVDFTLTDSNGALSVLDAASSTCDEAGPNLDASGQCTIVFTSNSAGTVTGHASVTLTVGGVSLTRETDGLSNNSGDAVKNFVDAAISIAPDATNEVGDPHTFTVTVTANGQPAGNGHVDFTLTDSNGAANVLDAASSTCDNAGENLDANGECTIVFTSNSAGQVTGHATVTLTVGGVSLTRETDGLSNNSDDAVKTFVDAAISIGPNATNAVGDPHTFTVTVTQDAGDGNGLVAAGNGHVDFTLTDSNGALSVLDAASSTCDEAGPNLDASGQCTIVFTSNSAGTVTGHASVTLTVGGVSLTRETDGLSNNSGDAVKNFVDAAISIAPDATNEVGDPHTFTVTVTANGQPAGNGHVDFTLTDSNGAANVLDAASSTCDNAGENLDANGECTIVFTSNSAGQVTGHATVTLTVGGVSLTRETDGLSNNSDDAVKTFVDAAISIGPNATNAVGDPHTFTVTVTQDAGDGNGLVAAGNGHVDFTLTDSNGALSVLDAASSTCDEAGPNLDASGQCTIVFTSNSAGTVTGHASVTLTVGGVSLTRETDGLSNNSGDAVKNFVDAAISIAPDATNFIYDPHTFTVTVTANGQPAGNGHVDFTLTDSNGAANVLDAASSTCDNAGENLDANGECTIVFTSNSAGQVTGHATVTLTVGGVSLSRETDGVSPNSDDAVKTFKSAQVTLNKTFDVGPFTSPGEACFTLTRNTYTGGASTDPPLSTDDATQCDTGASLSFTWHNLVPGTYTISETTTPAGYTTMADINFSVANDDFTATNLVQSFDRSDPLLPGSFKIKKTVSGGAVPAGVTFQFRVQPCGSDATCATPGTQITGSPFSIDSSTPNGTITITGLDEGYYLVTEINIPAGYTPDVNPQIVAVHASDVGTGDPVTVTFNNRPTELTALAPTKTTCTEFATGQALPQEDETYGLKKGVINNVSPGVFFFYASYSVTGSPVSLTVDAAERFNAVDGALTDDWVVQNGQAFLYQFANGTCTKLTVGVTTTINGGQVVITLDPAGSTPVPDGTYILGIKYTNSASLIGSEPCHGTGSSCHYYFIPSRDGTELTSRAQALLFRKR